MRAAHVPPDAAKSASRTACASEMPPVLSSTTPRRKGADEPSMAPTKRKKLLAKPCRFCGMSACSNDSVGPNQHSANTYLGG